MISDAKMTPDKLAGYYGNIADQIGDVSHMPLNFNLILDFESPDSFSANAVRNPNFSPIPFIQYHLLFPYFS